MSKYTPWFDGKVKPVRVGVYQTDGDVFQHWNGKFWGYARVAPDNAARHINDRSAFQSDRWRGLARKPK